MKKHYILPATILLCFVAALTSFSQTIRRVNNTPGSAAPYTRVQDAVAAASNGDIILIEGSQTAYEGQIDIDKKLTIQGPGYFLNENVGIQSNPYPATLSRAPVVFAVLNFNAGSAGSAIYGMTTNTINVNAANITIAGNNLGIVNFNTGADNFVMIDNYDGVAQINGNFATFLVANNVLSYMTMPTSNCFGVITNNFLYGGYSHVYNSPFSNNIVTQGPFVGVNAVITKNIFTFDPATYPGFTPVDATNLINVDYYSIFVGAAGHTTDSQWQLSATSPAKGFGTGGTDCGIFGGVTTPYKLSGVRTGQPTISKFVSPATVPQNGTLNIKVSAKVN